MFINTSEILGLNIDVAIVQQNWYIVVIMLVHIAYFFIHHSSPMYIHTQAQELHQLVDNELVSWEGMQFHYKKAA